MDDAVMYAAAIVSAVGIIPLLLMATTEYRDAGRRRWWALALPISICTLALARVAHVSTQLMAPLLAVCLGGIVAGGWAMASVGKHQRTRPRRDR